MNNKQRMDQIKSVILILKENHKKELANLTRIKQVILRKMDSVNRIITYRSQYEKMNTNSMSMAVPALMKNMSEFMKKLDVAIVEEKASIDKLEYEKIHIVNKLDELDKKIKALLTKSDALRLGERVIEENREAAMMDDMSAQLKSRETA